MTFEDVVQNMSGVSPFMAAAVHKTTNDAGGDPGKCLLMDGLADAVVENAKEMGEPGLRQLFSIVELALATGDRETRDAVATCFLENLQNIASGGRFDFTLISEYLGPESRAYCRAWDEFTGVKTEGL